MGELGCMQALRQQMDIVQAQLSALRAQQAPQPTVPMPAGGASTQPPPAATTGPAGGGAAATAGSAIGAIHAAFAAHTAAVDARRVSESASRGEPEEVVSSAAQPSVEGSAATAAPAGQSGAPGGATPEEGMAEAEAAPEGDETPEQVMRRRRLQRFGSTETP